MSIADKILRAKADLDAVYEAGKAAGGSAEPIEMVIEPDYIEMNCRFSCDRYEKVADENCDVYEYHIYNMFGATVKVKTALPDDSCNIYSDYEHELTYDNLDNEFEVPITTNDGFELWISCVRSDAPPQVVVSFKGIVVEKEPDYTACFDGSISGEYVDSALTTLRDGAFTSCENLTKVSLPNCVSFASKNSVGRYFYGCKALKTLELPSLKTINEGNYAFHSLDVERLDLPELTTINNISGTFWDCKNAKVINMPKLSGSSIGSFAFRNCSKLEALILGGSTLNPLTNTNAFNNANSNCIIYVNDNLVDSYKAATNWSTIASRIKGVSELED